MKTARWPLGLASLALADAADTGAGLAPTASLVHHSRRTVEYWDVIVGNGGQERAFDAMMGMSKISIVAIEAARRG